MASIDEQEVALKQEETAPDILAPTFANTSISALERAKIQAQVLVPVLRAFRAELGEARANQIASKALREWSQQLYLDVGEQRPGSPRQKWEAITAALIKRVGRDVDFELLKEEPDAWEFNITGCRYADFFRQLGEPELGALLTCEMDVDIEAVGSPEVTMTRTQTIMKGAKYCDFRYRLKTGGGAEK
jgi:hypothetical protein